MTTTNTPKSRPRRDADYYPTPAWCVHRLRDHIPFRGVRGHPTILEPSAGSGSIVRAFHDEAHEPEWFQKLNNYRSYYRYPTWTLVESRGECRESLEGLGQVHIQDFLQWEPPSLPFDYCVMNPPYSDADSHIRKALACSREVFALLRLQYIGSTSRRDRLIQDMPDVYVLPNRPSFIGTGERDASEYAWFHWKHRGTTSGLITVLGNTPSEHRR